MIDINEILTHLSLPSTVEKLEVDWAQQHEVEVYLKRDDQIHELISGNKWRKLSGVFKHNQAEPYTGIVTYGGAYSNHLIATACACNLASIPSKGVVRGERHKELNRVLQICEQLGMNLEYVSREYYKAVKSTKAVKNDWLHIPEGGACIEGTLGCMNIIDELKEGYDLLVIPCGTGTSLAGISKGVDQLKLAMDVVGVPVLKNGGFIEQEVYSLGGKRNFDLWLDYHFGGYAKTNPLLTEFITDFYQQTAVLLDPIYTSKTMFGLRHKIILGEVKPGTRVLAIHTGGLTGWLGMQEFLPAGIKKPLNKFRGL